MASRARLRRAVPGDEHGIAALVSDAFEDYRAFAPAGWVPIVEPPEQPRSSIDDPRGWGLVAEDGDDMVGVVYWVPAEDEPEVVHFRYLFVRPSHWGTGLAAGLHARALDAARDRGWRRMRLLTPAEQARARRFYEREGWSLSKPPFHEPRIGFDVVEYRRDL